MRVKLLNTYASEKGCFDAGTTLDLEDNEARQLIAGRYAEPVGVAAKVAAASGAPKAPRTADKKPKETRGAGPKPKAPDGDKKPKVSPPEP